MRIICLSIMGHSIRSDSSLWTVMRKKLWTKYKLYVSMCKQPCIQVHMAQSQHVFHCVFTWLCIHVQDLVMHYGPVNGMWLCAMGQCTEFGYTLWASAQNHCPCMNVKCAIGEYLQWGKKITSSCFVELNVFCLFEARAWAFENLVYTVVPVLRRDRFYSNKNIYFDINRKTYKRTE
jgi:hypothetical protein